MTEIEAFIYRNSFPDEEDLKKYFNRNYRGAYFGAMKTKAAIELRSLGYTYDKISKIVNLKGHVGAYHHVNYKKTDKEVQRIVDNNFNEWVNKGLIPKTIGLNYWNSEAKRNEFSKSYKLEKL